MRDFKKLSGPVLLAAFLLTGFASAEAAPISISDTFTATDFNIPGAPVDPVIFSFDLTFDPSLGVQANLTTIAITSSNIVVDSPVAFHVLADGSLFIGGTNGGIGIVVNGTNDFGASIFNPTTSPSAGQFFYSQTGVTGFTAGTTTLASSPSAPVPAPGALALLGLGLIGVAARRKAA